MSKTLKDVIATLVTLVSVFVLFSAPFLPDPPHKDPMPVWMALVLVPIVAYGTVAMFLLPFICWKWALDD